MSTNPFDDENGELIVMTNDEGRADYLWPMSRSFWHSSRRPYRPGKYCSQLA